ncbi:MAG TPA: exosortase/archaeosortase family protein [Nitrososphaerales archaeon]|nr:exosortase/archaeosortase family protein [Nitrososphaerales archaeon]
MKAWVRFFVWTGAAVVLTSLTAPDFIGLLDQSLGDTFGSVFPAIPFAALLTLILALRWPDLREVLEKEGGVRDQWAVRALGGAVIVSMVLLAPLTGLSVVTAGVAVVLTFYAAALVVNPLSRRFLLPYALIYAAGVGAPFVLQWAFGEPLAVVSSDLSARLVGLIGFPVSWQGTQFQLLSKTGDVINGVVTPGCSSIISVTTFLGLLALMHIDLRKDFRSTAILAAAGIVILTLLNSVRILLLMWVGYTEGSSAFWGIHNWIGYALFLGFYLAALPVYSRMGRGPAALPLKAEISQTTP